MTKRPGMTIVCNRSTLLPLLWICLLLTTMQAHAASPKHSTTEILKARIAPDNLPQHIAIIMDGNGRWANRQGKPRVYGHQKGTQNVREVVESCAELGIPYLTLYAFSMDNWERPQEEVNALMSLITTTISKELEELVEQKVQLTFVGDLQRLPQSCQQAVQKAVQASQHNQGLHLTIALSYSGRWDLTEAARKLAQAVEAGQLRPQDITSAIFQQYLATQALPDVDLLVRTSGEQRISGFLPWQLVYTEFLFTSVFWPDFRKYHLYEAIIAYQQRERRFGKLQAH
ncbi:MAG: isoprenyl transferase [Bacteroidota bacterium]